MGLPVDIEPKLLAWAMKRSGVEEDVLHAKVPKLHLWLNRSAKPTLKQLEEFARKTYTPVGFFFLREPPEEEMPIPDFRTMGDVPISRPSVHLLDTIYICQQRQEWYRDYALANDLEPLSFIGKFSLDTPIEQAAEHICDRLNFDLGDRQSMPTWEQALRSFVDNADAAGIMVMRNGVVLNNTRRKLDPEEFRGFALTDESAPLVFINGADTIAAQMFTLAHELAHLWLGETALSSADISGRESQTVERWCNRVAAELLVPLSVFKNALREGEKIDDALKRLAKRFKVSTLVILRRMLDAKRLSKEEYGQSYAHELERLSAHKGGGNFYISQPNKLSRRFARALIASALEGQTLYGDALDLLGVPKVATLENIGSELGGHA